MDTKSHVPSEDARTLLDSQRCGVFVVDVQESFLGILSNQKAWLSRLAAFLQIPKALDVPVLVTEQIPEKLGSTADSIRQAVPEAPIIPKKTFDCMENEQVLSWIEEKEIDQLLVTGIMSNICIFQTAVTALNRDHLVHVASDGVQAASDEDEWWSLQRMDRAGAVITTLETAAYEWMRSPEHPKFSDLLPQLKALIQLDQ